MVTNLEIPKDIPKELIDEAMALSGSRDAAALVRDSLQLMIRRHRYQELMESRGTLDLKIDLAKSRQRS